jgi:hypothetical protein
MWTPPTDNTAVPGNPRIGGTVPKTYLHITCPPIRSVLWLTNDIVRIECEKPAPNAWIRFWHRALLGWRWEKV